MPIYEYSCGGCRTTFDQLHRTMTSAADDPRPACPACGSMQTARNLSVFAVAADTAGGSSPAAEGGTCGCGRVPGSCGMG